MVEVDKEPCYVPPILDIMTHEWKNGAEVGDHCRVSELEKYFSWKRGFVNCWTGLPNSGKALDINELIPTPQGFRTMGSLKVGDQVYDENGLPCNVTYATGVQYNKNCYLMKFSDGTEIKCCEDHLWFTYDNHALASHYKLRTGPLKKRGNDQSHKRSLPRVITTKEIAETLMVPGKWKRYNHAVPVCKPVHGNYESLGIDPYVMGVWLGDGSSTGNRIYNHRSDYQIIEEIKKAGYTVTPGKTKQSAIPYGIGSFNQVVSQLRYYGVFGKGKKHIPPDYLSASYDQRLALLQGLMDTDGCISKTGICEYCSVNEELAKSVHALISSLGIKANIRKNDAKIYGRFVSYRYRIGFKTTLPVFRLERKLKRVPVTMDKAQNYRTIIMCQRIESVPVKCIQVDSPNKLYLASKSYIPTHNTTFLFFLLLLQMVFDKKKVAIWSPEMMSSHRTWEDLGGGKKKAKVRISANDIYNELIWMMTGMTHLKHISERHKIPMIGMPEYMKAKEFIEEHCFVLYPKDRTHTGVLNAFRQYYEMEGIDIFLADPYAAFKRLVDGRDDNVLSENFHEAKEFSIETHSSFNYIAHPKNLNEIREKGKNGQKGAFKVVDQSMLSGGAAWDQSMDGIYSIDRPEKHLDFNDPKVTFWNLKQRKQELVGKKGCCENIIFDEVKRKYYFNNVCPMDGSVREGYMKNDEQARRPIFDLFSRATDKNINDTPF